MFRNLFALWLFLLCTVAARAQQTVLYDGLNFPSLRGCYTWLEDSSGTMTAKTAAGLQREKKFRLWTGSLTFNKGVSKNIYWLYLPVKNATAETQEAVLRINSGLDSVQMYQMDSAGGASLLFTGSRYLPFDLRPFPYRYPAFPLKLKPQQLTELLLRVDNRNRGIYMPMYLQSAEGLLRSESQRQLNYGIYFGIFFFILLFNVFLFLSLKDKIHLWYAAYVFAAILFMIQNERFYTEWYPASWLRYLENLWVPPFTLLMISAGLRVMQLFVGQTRRNSRLFVPVTAMSYGCLLLSATMFLLSAFDTYAVIPFLKKLYFLTDVLFPLSLVLLISVLVEKIRQRQYMALYYLIGVLFMVFGSLNFYLNHLGITNFNLLKPNGVVVGLAFEIVFLSFLLTLRYNNLRKEKEQLTADQERAVADAVVQAQENERSRLSKDLHDGIGSSLTGISLLAQNYFSKYGTPDAQENTYRMKLLENIKHTGAELRTISHDLMPQDLERSGLTAVITGLVDTFNANNGQPKFDFIHRGNIDGIEKTKQIGIYRIVNELVQNIIKHADADKATIQCLLYNESLQLIVEDNGKGLGNGQARNGIGLLNIESRTRYMRGTVTIDSSVKGTTFLIEIPVTQNERLQNHRGG